MDSVALPTVMENGFGGAGMGAGFIGGLVLGSIWNGWGGWGGNRGNVGQVGADVALQNGIQNLSNQAQQNAISQLQSANQVGLQVANAAAGVTGAVNQNTISALQSNAGLSQQICCSTGRLSQEIDQSGDQTVAAINNAAMQSLQSFQTLSDKLCAINNNITAQNYENRLQAQALSAQSQLQTAQLSAQIADENCKDRELMRDIQAQAIRDQLGQAQAKIVQLETQNYVNQSNSQQTLYLIDQLKPATTTAGA